MPGMTDPVVEFEEDGNEAPEIVQLEEGQQIPEEKAEENEEPAPAKGRVLSDEEYAELLRGKDSTAALTDGLGKLAETLRMPAQPANVPQQQAGFDPKELEDEAWKPGGFTSAVQKILQQQMGQQSGPMAAALVQQNKKLLRLDPSTKENFETYEKEIENRVRSLPAQYQMIPDIYEKVYQQVVIEKQDEIVQRRAQKIAEAAVAKALEDAGITKDETGKPKLKNPAMYQESGVRTATVQPKPKQKLYITQADVQDMMEMGMDPKDPDQVWAYTKNIKARRQKNG